MFEFKVKGLSEASVEIDRGWPTKIVSLVSTYMPIEHQGDHHLIIGVEDVHVEDGDDYPTMAMLDHMLDFTKDFTEEDRVLVHCFAGQSRSTAGMLAILMQHGMHWRDAHQAVIDNRDIAMPNQLITKLLDEKHGLGGELVAHNNTYVAAKLREKAFVAIDDHKSAGVTDGQVSAMKNIMDLFK